MRGTVAGIGKLSGVVQPIYEVNRQGRALWALEGLVRGPKGSPLEAPVSLFAHARRLGVQPALDRAAMETVLESVSIVPGRPRIEVNVQASTLCRDNGFPRFVQNVAWGFSIPMSRLVVDVGGLDDSVRGDELAAAVKALRELGASVALDEEGLGVPDFGLLLAVRPDYVKVSGSLVRSARLQESNRDMLRALVDLGRSVGFRVIAEGVESLADVRCMGLLGLDLLQGYHFAHPVTAGAWRRGEIAERENVWDAMSA